MADHDANIPAKPELFLLPGDVTFEEVLELYQQITGKEPDQEKLPALRAEWERFRQLIVEGMG